MRFDEPPEKGTAGISVTGPIQPVSVAVAATVSVYDPVRDPGSGIRGPESGCSDATK